LGYEVWMTPAAAESVWDALMLAGRSRGIRAIGSQALNIARIEAGFISPHVDFVSAEQTIRTGRDRSPFELGLAWLVNFDKGHFTGRRALLAEQAAGPRRQLVGLDIAGNKPAHNSLVYSNASGKREIGSVSSAIWSPTCKRNIALAMVEAPYLKLGTSVWVEIYLNRELVWERRMSRAEVVERAFFAPARRAATPPADF
jgi:aminomethyltransferase